MRRMMAEVLESDWSPSADSDQSGLPWRDVTCRVKVLSGLPESHHLPDDIKDTTLTVRRLALFDHEYKPGSKLIVTPAECESLAGRPADIPEFGSLRGRAASYRTDINGDGFTERVVENSFLRVVIGPRFGARIWEIHHKRTGWNPLAATGDFSKGWIEIGGQEDNITWDDQGELWNARFDEKEVVTDDKGWRGVYEFKSEKSPGVRVVKEIRVPVDAPLVYFKFTLKYAGAEKPPEDGSPDEFEMRYWPRISVAVPNEKKPWYLFVVPTKNKLHRLRKESGWRDPRCFGMSAPYILAQDEDSGRCLSLLIDHTVTYEAQVKNGRSEFETIEPKMRIVKVPKGGEQSYGYALVLGDSAEFDAEGLSVNATGPDNAGETPVFALDTRASAGQLRSATDEGLPVKMNEVDYPGLPKVFAGTTWQSRNGGKGQ